ncbi:DASS family sodium-coupled anion symporter [Rossellomorea sp. RS05]|uniref:SLC13 family permease n=1 Tax=Rossellomorea sp. RS05 TaxID=3149166 RepID=UPI003221B3AA
MLMNAVTLWDSMWKTHDKTKQLLSFAIPSRKEKTLPGKEESSEQSNEPGNRSYKKGQMIGLILGPLLFLLAVLFVQPSDLSYEGRMVLAVTLWVATWWITEAIPIPATSLLPIILLPILSAVPMADVTASYGNPIVFLFLGGFMIALAMEKWNLHKRIALNIISVVGTSTSNIVLGFMIATGFLSMWVSNTAAVMMMIPIGTAITYQVSQALKGSKEDLSAEEEKFSKVLIFAIGYAGTIGGLGTLIGTPPNIILAGIVSELYGVQISFGGWMLFAVPVVILLLLFTWMYLIKIAHPLKIKTIPGGKELIQNEKASLGRMSFEEKAVSTIFVFAAFMWVSQSFLWKGIIPGIDDTMVAIAAGVVLFLIPARKNGGRLLDWGVAKDIPWGILLLFGGGLAIAGGFSSTGLAAWLGNQLKVLDGVSLLVMISVVTLLIMAMTEITSNTATATMILPIVASLALAINVHPYALMVPAAMAANCAFMLPVGTPPNAIIFATGKLKITEMVKNGFWVNVFCTFLIIGTVYLLLPLLWGVDLSVFPESFKS